MRDSIASVRDAILIGLILAAIILVLFLRDWGSSLVAGLVIPATIAITLIALRLLGAELQPDDAGRPGGGGRAGDRRRHRGGRKHRAASRFGPEPRRGDPQRAARDSRAAGGVDHYADRGLSSADHHHRRRPGTFFRALAVTVGTALLTSLALALTWTPTLSHYFLRERRNSHEEVATTGLMGPCSRDGTNSALRFVLALADRADRRRIVTGGRVVTSAIRPLGSDLLPEMDEGGFILDYLMPAGSSLDDTNHVLLGVEKILKATPEVESTSRRTGLQLGLAAVTEANRGDFSVKLKRDRDRGIDDDHLGRPRARSTRSIRSSTSNSCRCCRT